MSYEGCSEKSVEQEPVVQLGKRRTTKKFWGELSDFTSIYSHNKTVLQNRKLAKPSFKVVSSGPITAIEKPRITHQTFSASDLIADTRALA